MASPKPSSETHTPSASGPSGTPEHVHVPAEELAARYGKHDHIVFHEAFEKPKPRRIRDLVAEPVIRQWIEGGKLHREPSTREVPGFELFFDLLFVGIIHQLAESALEPPGGLSVVRFILTFYPSWSVWEEARRYSNVSGRDDMLHRVWVLVGMICMLGYSVNASAINIYPEVPGEGGETAAQHLARSAVQWIVPRPNNSEGGNGKAVLDSTPVHCAAAFWLIIKASRVIVLWFYAWRLPDFRVPQFLSGCAVLVPMCVYLPLLWVNSRRAQVAIAIAGICVDLLRVDVLFFYIGGRWMQWKEYRKEQAMIARGELDPADAKMDKDVFNFLKFGKLPPDLKIPAINIEHSIERSSAFVVIVTGELVANLLYVAGKGQYGASEIYGKATLGLMIAWAITYLYMVPNEDVNQYQHALRRSWLTGVLFSFFHWPLCAAITLASAACGYMINNDVVDAAITWYWGCGLGFAVLFMAALDMLHHDLNPWRACRIPRIVRFCISVTGALALILYPLAADHLDSLQMLGIAVGITWSILIVNIIGILPARGTTDAEDDEAAPLVETEVLDLHSHEYSHPGRPHAQNAFRDAVEERFGVMANT